jgi:uncharacterized protein with HEPN domain
MSERSVILLLQDINEAISNILAFTNGFDLEAYSADLKTRHAVEHNFMIIGEAVARIPDQYKAVNTNVNWREIKDFRNVLVHEYFGIDNSIVWNIIRDFLPVLQKQVGQLRIELND